MLKITTLKLIFLFLFQGFNSNILQINYDRHVVHCRYHREGVINAGGPVERNVSMKLNITDQWEMLRLSSRNLSNWLLTHQKLNTIKYIEYVVMMHKLKHVKQVVSKTCSISINVMIIKLPFTDLIKIIKNKLGLCQGHSPN